MKRIMIAILVVLLMAACTPAAQTAAPVAEPASTNPSPEEAPVEETSVATPAQPVEAGPSLVVPLGWLLNDEFTALVAAEQLGFYAEEGLSDVTLVSGGGSTGFDPVKAVNGMDSEIRFGVPATMTEIIQAHSQGIDAVVVAAMFQTEPGAYMTLLEDGKQAKSPCDLKGRVVAIPSDSQWYAGPLGAACPEDQGGPLVPGEDFTVIPGGFTPDCLLSKQCDFYVGWTTNQPFVLEQNGLKQGEDYDYFLLADYLPFYYGDVIITTRAYIEQHPEIVKAFVAGTVKGLQYVVDHPEEGVQIASGIEGVDPEHAKWRIPVQNQLVVSNEAATYGPGYVDVDKVQSMIQFLYDNGQIPEVFDAKEIVDNSFLPAASQ